MSYISNRRARLQAQLARIQAALANLYDTLAELSASGVESYTFDSGEGSQKTTRRKLASIQDQIDRLEAAEDHIVSELYNVGVVNIRLRRKRPW